MWRRGRTLDVATLNENECLLNIETLHVAVSAKTTDANLISATSSESVK